MVVRVEGTAQTKACKGGIAYGVHSRIFCFPWLEYRKWNLHNRILAWKPIVSKSSVVYFYWSALVRPLKPGLCPSLC